MQPHSAKIDTGVVRALVRELIYPERGFIRIAIAYGVVISLLTLAVPVAVQTLINTVVNIASVNAVITLATLLFVTLTLSGLFSAMRTYIMERYERHIYARLTAEISIRTLMTEHQHFDGRRNTDITNRYFDINTFQKNLPPLVIDGFALFLQMLVGFTLVSFYHPVFLAFSLLMVITLYLIWAIWGRRAIRTAVNLSHAKYSTAKWLGDITAAHAFFKSSRHLTYAREQTEAKTAEYIREHTAHFRLTFTQTICLLVLYALASSTLLGVGGFLVIRGELSIGQLVAAELILTAIFFGLSQASTYLKLYYELCGAADEIGQVFNLPQESVENGNLPLNAVDTSVAFSQVCLEGDRNNRLLDFELKSGEKAFVVTREAWLQRGIVQLLKHHDYPSSGWIRLAGHDLRDYNLHQLRQAVWVIDRSLIVECRLRDYMTLSAPEATTSQIEDALFAVGLRDTIKALPDGLDTHLSSLGLPLQPHEFLLLKLAAALISEPKTVILTQYFDNLPIDDLIALLKMLSDQSFSVMYFTNHPSLPAFDYCLDLDRKKVASKQTEEVNHVAL